MPEDGQLNALLNDYRGSKVKMKYQHFNKMSNDLLLISYELITKTPF